MLFRGDNIYYSNVTLLLMHVLIGTCRAHGSTVPIVSTFAQRPFCLYHGCRLIPLHSALVLLLRLLPLFGVYMCALCCTTKLRKKAMKMLANPHIHLIAGARL